MKNEREFGFTTNQLHGSKLPSEPQKNLNTPIYQSNFFPFEDTEHAVRFFTNQEFAYVSTLISNPTTTALEQRTAMLEGGKSALATSSGHAAHMIAILSLCQANDHIVSSSKIFGGTLSQFKDTLQQIGITHTLVDPSQPKDFAKAIQPNTKLIFGETLSNPDNCVFPFEEVAAIAKAHKIPLIIDNSLTTPYLCKPIDWGANIVTLSTGKYLGGLGQAMGGIIVDADNFDWTHPRFANLKIESQEKIGQTPFILRARFRLMRDTGACQSPFNSWNTLMGIETLSLRMECHCRNALQLAKYLEKHPAISRVVYAGLESHPDFNLALKYLPKGVSGVMGFNVKGGLNAAKSLVENVKLFRHAFGIGDTKSLIVHPASSLFSNLTPAEMIRVGVTPDFVRISVGLEDAEDLIWDLNQALAQSTN